MESKCIITVRLHTTFSSKFVKFDGFGGEWRRQRSTQSTINLFFSIQLFENELMEEKLMSEGQMPQPAEIFFILFISLIINEIEKELKRLKAGGALQ